MSKPIRSFEYYDSLDFAGLAPSKLQIEVFSPQESSELVALIRESMEELDQKEKLFPQYIVVLISLRKSIPRKVLAFML